jgi:hypothetical protein
MVKNRFIRGFFIVVCILGCGLLLGALLMFLWNWLVPSLFSGPEITFIQALGLFILGKILFGGFRGGWKCGKRCCGGWCHGGGWRKRFEEKYAKLSEEEKAKLKESYKRCCGIDEC